MAARMSWALAFSLLAMGEGEVGQGRSEREAGRSEELRESGAAGPAGAAGVAVSVGLGDSGSDCGRESKSEGWRRDALTRAACDGERTPLLPPGKAVRFRPAETRRANGPSVP